jgi:protein DJ-1
MSGNLVVHKLVRDFIAKGKYVGMICAGMSTCLSQREIILNSIPLGSLAALSSGLPSQPLTSHPSVKEDLQSRESHLPLYSLKIS